MPACNLLAKRNQSLLCGLQGHFVLAFRLTKDALRFCHAAQAALLLREWSSEAFSFFPRPVLLPDDRPIMAVPPLAMAIHESTSYRYALVAERCVHSHWLCALCWSSRWHILCSPEMRSTPRCPVQPLLHVRPAHAHSRPDHASAHPCPVVCSAHPGRFRMRTPTSIDASYTGPGIEATQALAHAAHGGQVVLSEQAWAVVQDQLPGLAQVCTSYVMLVWGVETS